ncbi:MAG TPA: hypothetical protein VGD27_00745 [Longimicrobiales bacterium]
MNKTIRLLAMIAIAIMATAAQAHAQQLQSVMSRFAGAWRQNDDKAIAGMIAREGASIETPAGRLGPLGARQTAAVLRVLFDERATQDVRTRQVHEVGGSPQKAYAEVIWTSTMRETTQATRVVVFVELMLEQERYWRITRIRLITPE